MPPEAPGPGLRGRQWLLRAWGSGYPKLGSQGLGRLRKAPHPDREAGVFLCPSHPTPITTPSPCRVTCHQEAWLSPTQTTWLFLQPHPLREAVRAQPSFPEHPTHLCPCGSLRAEAPEVSLLPLLSFATWKWEMKTLVLRKALGLVCLFSFFVSLDVEEPSLHRVLSRLLEAG